MGEPERLRAEIQELSAEYTRLSNELTDLLKTLDPRRTVATEEELAIMGRLGEIADRRLAAEHALDKAEHGTPGITGTHSDYQWISSVDFTITDLLRLCPDVVVGKYLAVTSNDSGAFQPAQSDIAAGWRADGGRVCESEYPGGPLRHRGELMVAYSPAVKSIESLPREIRHDLFIEWYVFSESAPPDRDIESFVNWGGFRLYEHEWDWFWRQMDDLRPESYIGGGIVLTFATRNRELFERVTDAFKS